MSEESCHVHTVLVIDDDAELRERLRREIAADGFDVITAVDLDEGLDVAARWRPKVIVMNAASWNGRETTGIQLVGAFFAMNPFYEVIVRCAYRHCHRAIRAGAYCANTPRNGGAYARVSPSSGPRTSQSHHRHGSGQSCSFE
jgi:DNA-binding NtrC family response regulator